MQWKFVFEYINADRLINWAKNIVKIVIISEIEYLNIIKNRS